ncbi:MAG: hypothetical protein J6A90_06095 [Clostridia bacterium]|nr:hypothetical protein [Clostridia bacterium]
MIPAIASFFGVSTDELFDFNIYEIEQRVDKIVDEHRLYLDTDVKKSEQIIRNGLKKYPGNEILLNCLINIISATDIQAINVLKAFENDFETSYTHSKHDPEKIKELENKLNSI